MHSRDSVHVVVDRFGPRRGIRGNKRLLTGWGTDALAQTEALPEHVRTGSLPVEKLLQQLRHRAAAATPLAAGVATSGVATTVVTSRVATAVATAVGTTAGTTAGIGGGAAGRERVQQPAQGQG